MSKETTTIVMVAGELVLMKKGTVPGRVWYVVRQWTDQNGSPSNKAEDNQRIYKGRGLSTGVTPGMIRRFKASVDPEHTSVYGRGEYLGMWSDGEWSAKISMEDRALLAQVAAKKAEKKEAVDPLINVLAPLQRIYNHLPAPARAQMIARVVHELQKGTDRRYW